MRITTQVLNTSMRKAGLPVDTMSLLSGINSSSQSNGLLSALSKDGRHKNGLLSVLDKYGTTSQVQKKNYEKLNSSAKELQQTAEALHSKEIYDEAREKGDNKAILEQAEALMERYNDALKSLKKSTTPLNQYYRQMLTDAGKENKESLESIGITQEKDGTLKLDQDKLKASSTDALEQAFGGVFTEKLSFLAERVADNAKANANSASSQYNAAGNNYFAQANSFDFLG